jgi:TatD DNase family protein
MLVDSHCHLDFPDFKDDFADMLGRAKDAGIETMMTICTHITKFDQVLAVAKSADNIYCTVGIHPHEAENEPEITAEDLIAKSHDPKVIGFGETGLDFFYDHAPRDKQERAFRAHIEASRQTGLPIIIHTRAADDRTIAIIDEEMEKGRFPGLIHCFSSGAEVAACALRHGLYISISGIVTFKKAQDLQNQVAKLPLESLLVETDAPYLAPVPKRGKRNEPAFTAHTAQQVADLRGITYAEVAAQTTNNFYSLFTKAQRPTSLS